MYRRFHFSQHLQPTGVKILAVDHGDRKIGLAISDELGLVARPLTVVLHRSRAEDARAVARLAASERAGRIVVGLPLDDAGEEGYHAQRVRRWAGALNEVCDLPVEFWDESHSTAGATAVLRRKRRGRRRAAGQRPPAGGPDDAVAAAVILQSYLDAHRTPP